MINNLNFLNRNLYREYPIRQGYDRIANNGTVLPDFVISTISLSIPTVVNATDYIPYISQVYINNGAINLAISVEIITMSGSSYNQVGYFSGALVSDFQSFNLIPFDGLSSGSLITGQVNQINTSKGLYFYADATHTALEISTYLIFPPPLVQSLNYRNQTLTGAIGFGTMTNITELNSGNNCLFDVPYTAEITSIADTDSQFRNCPTPVITNINGAVPYPIADLSNDANIYLFGVNPIVFLPDNTNASLNVTTGSVTLQDFCTEVGQTLPPINPTYLVNRPSDSPVFVGDERYYSKSQSPIENFLTQNLPEYVLWPYFATTFTTDPSPLISPTAGTYIVAAPPNTILGNISRIYAITDTGSVNFTVKIGSTNVTGLVGLVADDNGLVVLPTANFSFNASQTINLIINSLSGTPEIFSFILYYVPQPTVS